MEEQMVRSTTTRPRRQAAINAEREFARWAGCSGNDSDGDASPDCFVDECDGSPNYNVAADGDSDSYDDNGSEFDATVSEADDGGYDGGELDGSSDGKPATPSRCLRRSPSHDDVFVDDGSKDATGSRSPRSTEKRDVRLGDLAVIGRSTEKTTPKKKNGRAKHVAWLDRFRELEEYKAKHGDCNVPREGHGPLGKWVDAQRHLKKNDKLSPEREQLLSSL